MEKRLCQSLVGYLVNATYSQSDRKKYEVFNFTMFLQFDMAHRLCIWVVTLVLMLNGWMDECQQEGQVIVQHSFFFTTMCVEF